MKKSKIAQRVANTENMPSYEELFALVADLSDVLSCGMHEHDAGSVLMCDPDVARKYAQILRNVEKMTTDNNLWFDISMGTFLD